MFENSTPDLTLVSSLEIISSLPPFPTTKLSYNFHYITCIDFTYHPNLYHNHVTWIEYILPILQLLVSPFYLKYIFLLSHRDPNNPCPLESLVFLIQPVIISCNISTNSILSHNLRDNFSCSRSFLYLSLIKISLSSLFIPVSTLSFPSLVSLLSSTFNSPYFSHFTTSNLNNTSP